MTKKQPKPAPPKVWYAVETSKDVTESEIYCYKTIEGASSWIDEEHDGKVKLYAFEIKLLGEVEVTKKTEVKLKK
jgi:hypothetical protein